MKDKLDDKNKIRLYCRKCHTLVEGLETYLEEKVLPEKNPEFDIVTYCCPICNSPITEITKFHKE